MKESICARSLPLWSDSYRPPGMEQRGSVGVRREHGFREAQSIHLRLNTEFAAVFFFKSLSKWTKVVIKLISCVNFFFFLHVVVENRNRKSQVCVSSERNPQWWVCTPALIGPIDLLGCIYNCLEIVNRC